MSWIIQRSCGKMCIRDRSGIRKKLKEKWKEAAQAVFPIIGIVLLLCFTIAPISPSVLLCFLMGAVLILSLIHISSAAADRDGGSRKTPVPPGPVKKHGGAYERAVPLCKDEIPEA